MYWISVDQYSQILMNRHDMNYICEYKLPPLGLTLTNSPCNPNQNQFHHIFNHLNISLDYRLKLLSLAFLNSIKFSIIYFNNLYGDKNFVLQAPILSHNLNKPFLVCFVNKKNILFL